MSIATISRALRPETEHLVRETLRSRIKERAREVNYVPNPAAQSMRMRKNMQVSLIIPHDESIFYSEFHSTLLVAMLMSSKHYPMDLRIDLIHENGADFIDTLRSVSHGSSGIIYVGNELSEKNSMALRQLNKPLTILRACLPGCVDAADVPGRIIGVDNVSAGYIATKHLLDNGHRNVVFVTDEDHIYDVKDRKVGFRKALDEYEITFSPLHIVSVPLNFTSGFKAWEKVSALPERPTAVLCGNDELARGLIKASNKFSLVCPNELAVVGFDDSRLAYFASPTLTSVQQPMQDVGWALVNAIFHLIKNKWTDQEIHHEQVYQPKLIIRESSAQRMPSQSVPSFFPSSALHKKRVYSGKSATMVGSPSTL